MFNSIAQNLLIGIIMIQKKKLGTHNFILLLLSIHIFESFTRQLNAIRLLICNNGSEKFEVQSILESTNSFDISWIILY